jgi:DNA-binding MarR family transcriptional regulator
MIAVDRIVHTTIITRVSEPSPTVAAILAELAPVMARQRETMARHGCLRAVSHTTLHVLMLLETEPRIPMSRLAEQLDVSLPNLTGIVGRMEERRLVERVRDEHDRRVVLVRPTSAGRAAVQEADATRQKHLAVILEAMTPEQQATCLAAFRALRETADRLHAEGALDAVDHEHAHPHPARTATSRAVDQTPASATS